MFSLSYDEVREGVANGRFPICVVGLGRMGLPTACLFAEAGAKVIGVDSNLSVVRAVNAGKAPFHEPDLDALLAKVVREGRLSATNEIREAVKACDVILLIVPTTITPGKSPDYSALEKACKEVGISMKRGSLVIVESTVGPGVTETLVKGALESGSGMEAGKDFGLAYCPIRASAGQVLRDLASYNRIIAGIDKNSLESACAVFSLIVKGELIKLNSLRAAEAAKLFENIYRDVNIALANELSKFCEKAGLNYQEVAEAANTQPFCHLHRPGMVGGHCIPFNPYFLIDEAESLGVDLQLVRLARKVNEAAPRHAIKLIAKALRESGRSLRGARILIIGASYKPNVKEGRYSPTAQLYEALKRRGARPEVYDPLFRPSELRELGYNAASLDDALERADCVVIAVGHEEVRKLKQRILRKLSRKQRASVVDCSGMAIFGPWDSSDRVKCLAMGVG